MQGRQCRGWDAARTHPIRGFRKNIGILPIFTERVAQLFQRPFFNA